MELNLTTIELYEDTCNNWIVVPKINDFCTCAILIPKESEIRIKTALNAFENDFYDLGKSITFLSREQAKAICNRCFTSASIAPNPEDTVIIGDTDRIMEFIND